MKTKGSIRWLPNLFSAYTKKGETHCKIKTDKENLGDLQYPQLKFTGTVNVDYLKKHADELRRVAASVLTGTVSVSLLINKKLIRRLFFNNCI